MELIKFFAVVSFVITDFSPGAWQNLYVFVKPHTSMEQCVSYVRDNKELLFSKAANVYNYTKQPDTIYCVGEDKLKEIMKEMTNGSKTQDI